MERFRIRQIGGTNGVWGILVCKLRLRDVSANSLVFDLSKREKIKSRKRQKTRKWISISYRSTYCNQRLKHLLSSLFASTFASRAVSSTDNKLQQQSDNLDFKTLPFLTIQLVPIPRPPTAHKALDTSVFAQKGKIRSDQVLTP